MPLSDDYKPPIRLALIQQGVVGLFCLLLLDGGKMAQLCGIVVLAFWTGVGVIMFRRSSQPTEADMLVIKYAFVPLLIVFVVITNLLGLSGQ